MPKKDGHGATSNVPKLSGKSAASVLDNRHDKTNLLCQPTTAHKYRKPSNIH